jgi:hypothetical protein
MTVRDSHLPRLGVAAHLLDVEAALPGVLAEGHVRGDRVLVAVPGESLGCDE